MALPLGATQNPDGSWRFVVWAPNASNVSLDVLGYERQRMLPMPFGYYMLDVPNLVPNSKYRFELDGRAFPDPASRSQPDGVHDPSQLLDARFEWHDASWCPPPLAESILYEIHVGTFTAAGTFDAIIPELTRLVELGITTIELMPVCQFAGTRNWGYDGVYLFAVQNTYGGPDGLRRLVDACHQHGIAVLLDMVYNHFGSEGNVLSHFAPYFTDRYHGAWGQAINFDGAFSDGVREFFFQNAIYWIDVFHIDGFRFDAIDHVVDTSAIPFWDELTQRIHRHGKDIGRTVLVTAESDQNNARVLRPRVQGGVEMDAHWLYDFHHALFPLLVKETIHYYSDFGEFDQLVQLFCDGYVYQGQYAPRRRRRWGTSADSVQPSQLIAYMQTHDRVGNRPHGERLAHLLSLDGAKLAAALTLLSPFTPLLFMGEEYGENAPFLYFTDVSDPDFASRIDQGRLDDAKGRGYSVDKPLPKANALETFLQSKIHPELRHEPQHRALYAFYKELIRLRKTLPALKQTSKDSISVTAYPDERVLVIRRLHTDAELLLIANFNTSTQQIEVSSPNTSWSLILTSAEGRFHCDQDGQETSLIVKPSPLSMMLLQASVLQRT